jgi:hypothetical protein
MSAYPCRRPRLEARHQRGSLQRTWDPKAVEQPDEPDEARDGERTAGFAGYPGCSTDLKEVASGMDEKRPGRVAVQSGTVRYSWNAQEVWSFSVGDIRLVGEWTNSSGPFFDDYYYLFAVGNPPLFYEIPMYDNCHLLDELAAELREELQPQLAGSTVWASRVIWPPALEGQTLFDLQTHRRGQSAIAKLLDRVVPRTTTCLSSEVKGFLGLL